MTETSKAYWEKVYSSEKWQQMGWFEEHPAKSLELIEKCNMDPFDIILDVGAGASTLVDELLQQGHRQVVATDFCDQALKISKQRLEDNAKKVKWIVDDLLQPVLLRSIEHVALWHDRAVLHYLTHPEQRNAYFKTLNAMVKVNGFVIIAAFSLSGDTRCSDLNVVNYDERTLSKLMGNRFKLLDAIDYTHKTPDGQTRPYIYTRFIKIE